MSNVESDTLQAKNRFEGTINPIESTIAMNTRKVNVSVNKYGVLVDRTITVPTDEAIHDLAMSLHKRGKEHRQYLIGCNVSYEPADPRWYKWLEAERQIEVVQDRFCKFTA